MVSVRLCSFLFVFEILFGVVDEIFIMCVVCVCNGCAMLFVSVSRSVLSCSEVDKEIIARHLTLTLT